MGKQTWYVLRDLASRPELPFLQGISKFSFKSVLGLDSWSGHRIYFMLWSTDILDTVLFLPASVIPHLALPDFGRMKATILLKHHSTSVLYSAVQEKWLEMLFAWVRRSWLNWEAAFVILIWENACVYQGIIPSIYLSSLPFFSWPVRFYIGKMWQPSFCVFTFSLSPLWTNKLLSVWYMHLYNAYRLLSLMNAPKRSEYSACIANQHQLCALTAPDVSSKMNCFCSAVHEEQCMQGWDQTLKWPLRARTVDLHGKCSNKSICTQV